MKRIRETFSIEIQEVKVIIRVDYDRMKVSIMEYNENFSYKKKNWCFTGGTAEYEERWTNILYVLQVGMKAGFKKLKQEQERRDNVTKENEEESVLPF